MHDRVQEPLGSGVFSTLQTLLFLLNGDRFEPRGKGVSFVYTYAESIVDASI